MLPAPQEIEAAMQSHDKLQVLPAPRCSLVLEFLGVPTGFVLMFGGFFDRAVHSG